MIAEDDNAAEQPGKTVMLVVRDRADLPMPEIRKYVAAHDLMLVTIRKGGQAAIEELRDLAFRVDLVVTDFELPESSGAVLTMAIRAEERAFGEHIPVYWATAIPFRDGDIHDPIVKAAKLLRVERILRKPYDVIEILEELE